MLFHSPSRGYSYFCYKGKIVFLGTAICGYALRVIHTDSKLVKHYCQSCMVHVIISYSYLV